MKKKIVVLLRLVLVMCSLLCGCGGNKINSEVKSALLGDWVYPNAQEDGMCVVTFDEDIVTTYTIYDSITTEPMEQKYTIKEDTIVIKYDSSEFVISYSYEDGQLRLFTKTGTELMKYTGADEETEETTNITEEDVKEVVIDVGIDVSEDVKEVALDELYDLIQSEYQFQCNPQETTYSIGTIKQTDDNEYVVKGTLKLYDDYGNLAYMGNFSVEVEGDSVKDLRAERPDIELY